MSSEKPLMEDVDFEDRSSSSFDGEYHQPPPTRAWKVSTVVLAITTVIFAATTIGLYIRQIPGHSSQKGYDTEFGPARSSIEKQQVRFTSALVYNESSQLWYREHDPAQPQFVGEPKPEIDEAWDKLLQGQYIVVTKEESSHLENPMEINGYYFGEVEVMHSLHCLNAIRKALYPEYYAGHAHHGASLPEYLDHIHVEHCIDQLRQTIQCAGDLTPVPLRLYGERPNAILAGTPQVHTCRNWDSFREWYTMREKKYGSL